MIGISARRGAHWRRCRQRRDPQPGDLHGEAARQSSLGRPVARLGDLGLGRVAIGAPLVRATMATAMSAPSMRLHSRGQARSGASCARPRRVASCTRSTRASTGSSRRQRLLEPVAQPLATALQGRAPVPGHQAAVWPREDPLLRLGQEPCTALHAVRARQPVPGPAKAYGMRTSLPESGRAAADAAPKPRNRCHLPGNGVPATLRRPSRQSRSR